MSSNTDDPSRDLTPRPEETDRGGPNVSFDQTDEFTPSFVMKTGSLYRLAAVEPTDFDSDAIAMPGGANPVRYDDKTRIDEGGMGAIHCATDLNLQRQIAIKSLKLSARDDPREVRLFFREAQITAQLDHPNIVPVYNVFDPQSSEGTFAFTMKFVRGETWEEAIQAACERFDADPRAAARGERAALQLRLEQFRKVCEAIDYAHAKGIIHRDLKPANIMIGAHGEVYVMDWGIACREGEGARDGSRGTLRYMSPEQSRGEITPSGDLFSLGLILYELASLRRAYEDQGDRLALMKRIMTADLPPLQHRAGAPIHPDLKAIIARATQAEPGDRYPGVSALSEDVARFLRGEEVSARPDNLARRVLRWIGEHRLESLALLSGLLLLTAIALIFSLNSARAAAEERQRTAEVEATLAEERTDRLAQQRRNEARVSAFQAEVSDRANVLDRHMLRAEDHVQALADVAQLLLAAPPSEAPLFDDAAHGDPARRPEDTRASSIYNRTISATHPAYAFSPNADEARALDQLRRLAPIRHLYRKTLLRVGQSEPELFSQREIVGELERVESLLLDEGVPGRWVFIGLEAGAIFTYPGATARPSDYDARARPWYRQARTADQPVWGEIYEDSRGQGLLIPCAAPIYDGDGAFQGVAGLDFTLDTIVQSYLTSERPGFIEAYLMNPHGHIIARTRDLGKSVEDASPDGERFHDPALAAAAQQQPSGIVASERDGRATTIAYQTIPTVGWVYVVEVDREALLASPAQ